MTQWSKQQELAIKTDAHVLHGTLSIPLTPPRGLVIFAHGSGSSRFSTRNRFVADALNDAGLATLLFDLLSEEESVLDQANSTLRFNIPMLSERLTGVVDWAQADSQLGAWPIGLFGASTGAAAALTTAAQRPESVAAVVSRGGRPDLAGPALRRVQAPTLLIVGEDDPQVLELNRQAALQMPGKVQTRIIPGATHLFEEPGALEQVAQVSRQWLTQHLGTAGPPRAGG